MGPHRTHGPSFEAPRSQLGVARSDTAHPSLVNTARPKIVTAEIVEPPSPQLIWPPGPVTPACSGFCSVGHRVRAPSFDGSAGISLGRPAGGTMTIDRQAWQERLDAAVLNRWVPVASLAVWAGGLESTLTGSLNQHPSFRMGGTSG